MTGEPWIARTPDELLAGAEARVSLNPADARSGSMFERVTINGEQFFVKTLGYRTDWIMRVTGDHDVRTLKIWRAGIMHDVPREIDHGVVGMCAVGEGEDAMLTILMRDLGEHLFPEGRDDPISLQSHLDLTDGLAALSAHYWGWEDEIGLTTLEERLRFFAPDNLAPEGNVADPPLPVRVAAVGWPRLAELAPEFSDLCAAIHAAPRPLADAMRTTPATFLHGDWKMGNLGHYPDGRTILLDWAYPGSGPMLWDFGWYLALNAARLPTSKEDSIEALRAALERRGIATASWFDLQLDLCLLGIATSFAWEKAVGSEAELGWWERRARLGARHVAEHYPVPRARG